MPSSRLPCARHVFLSGAGLCSAAAVAVVGTSGAIAGRFRSSNRVVCLLEQLPEIYQWIFREWQFPIYDLDLKPVEVKLETLRKPQRNWCPDGY